MLQARQRGKELVVGIHSDEAILENKGPTVMTLDERVAATDACRWVTKSVPYAPYVTSLPWISHYGCYYVVHGDDITSDASGEDCYRFVKAAGRFLVVKRTPGISTTDLVGRMLLCTRTHFIKSLTDELAGSQKVALARNESKMGTRCCRGSKITLLTRVACSPDVKSGLGRVRKKRESGMEHRPLAHSPKLVDGKGPVEGQKVVYVDGGFDLFSSGHIRVSQKSQRGLRKEKLISSQASTTTRSSTTGRG